MLKLTKTVSNYVREHISKFFLFLLLILMSIVVGVLTLVSVKISLIIVIVSLVVTLVLFKPFAMVVIYLILLYTRPYETISSMQNMPLIKYAVIGMSISWAISILYHKKKDFVKTPESYCLVAFFLTLMLSMRSYVHGMMNIFSDFGKIVVAYFLLINLIETEKQLKITMWLMVAATVYLAVHGSFISESLDYQGEQRIYSSGMFADPNALAMAIIVMLPMAFNLFFTERLVLKRILLLIFSGFMLYAIALTASRGSFLGLVPVIFLMLRDRLGTMKSAVISLCFILLFLLFGPVFLMERMKDISLESGTVATRIGHWQDGWQMFRSNPILGVGKGRFVELSEGHFVAHNSFIQVASEAGILGIGTWFSLFYFTFRNLMRVRRAILRESGADGRTAIINSMIIGLIGFIVCGSFITRSYDYVIYILIALSVSACNMFRKTIPQPVDTSVKLKDVVRISIITLGFLFGWPVFLRIV